MEKPRKSEEKIVMSFHVVNRKKLLLKEVKEHINDKEKLEEDKGKLKHPH